MDKYLGKRLDGRYEMRELIGIGGMAYVYKAYDAADDRIVAVKILRDEFLSNEEFTRRFRNESKAIAILNHPNVVKVLDVGFGERLQYIVMEYIDGISLKEYFDQRKDIRWKEAVHFAVQILRALQHAHDKGIVHRDIKPQNIMLLSDGTIKVTDFGIARLSRNELRATDDDGKAIGSVHYISPEQARGEITDEKADLYSVGVMLYEMLTGALPFEADNAVSVAIMQMQSEPKLPRTINADIPEGLEQITMKAMQKDCAKRYQSAAEMLCDFDEFKRNPSIKFEYTYFGDDNRRTRYVDAITRVRGESGEGSDGDGQTEPSGKKKLSMVAILSAVAAAIVVMTVVFVMLFTNFFRGGGRKEIQVDDFVGMSYTDEVSKHPNVHNYELVLETGYTDEYESGKVYKQDPPAGSSIKMKGKLILYVSKGSRLETVPMVTPGESANMVRSRLADKGFVVKEAEESSLECKKGTVIRVEPQPGEQVQYGSEIMMYISSGEPAAEPIEMSNVNGMEVNDAIEKLVDDGFDRNKIQTKYVNEVASKDTVIQVSPDHSQKQLPDVTITLTVSSGFRNVTIDLPLPRSGTMVDLQFIVNGRLHSELTGKHKNIVPAYVGTLDFQVTETKESYRVLVRIAKAGAAADSFTDYAEYTVNGKTGEYKLVGSVNKNWQNEDNPQNDTSSDASDTPDVSDPTQSDPVDGAEDNNDTPEAVG